MLLDRQKIDLISAIANRAVALYAEHGIKRKKLDAMMDIEFTDDVIPLDLTALLAADDSNFAHDIIGIGRHFNRATLQMEDCFLPRYAKNA